METAKCIRGSEWRKWDLHIHTKGTSKNDQFISVDFNAFCVAMFKKAIEKDINVIGVTDYFCIKNYKQVVEFQKNIDTNTSFTNEEKNKISEIFILPNVELRILPVTDKGRLINIHCIFNPNFISNLDNDFFNRIKSQDCLMNKQGFISLGKSLDAAITDEIVALKKGVDNFVVSHENLKKLLTNNPNLRENIIIVVSNSSNDGASAIQKHYDLFENENGSLDGVRKTIYQISDCIFSSNESDIKFFAGKHPKHSPEVIKQKCGSLKPCIHGSDAHMEDKLFNPDNNRYCWIKADLTFNGLKQIIYEPDERVKIQETKPDEKRGYQVIDSVSLNENGFWNGIIYLNENLNTIIGGRSTGKSTLLKSIAKKIDEESINDENSFIQEHIEGITIKWKDGESNISRDIDFFPQSYMHEIADDSKKTDELVLGIINEKIENKALLDKYKSDNDVVRREISTALYNVNQIKETISSHKDKLKQSGDKNGIGKEIGILKSKITELHKNSSLTEDELSNYQQLLQNLSDKERNIQQLDKDVIIIERLNRRNIINDITDIELDNLSQISKGKMQTFFTNLKLEINARWITELQIYKQEILSQKQLFQTNIEQIKQSDNYKKGEKQNQDNKELNDIQEKLKVENQKLQTIQTLESEISRLDIMLNTNIQKIIDNHYLYFSNAKYLTENLAIEHEGIRIVSKSRYKNAEIRNFLENRLNLRGSERQRLVDDLISKYETDIKEQSKFFLLKSLNNEIDYKNYNISTNVIQEFFTTNWFDVSFELSYQNDVFSEMSQGKQAFVILKLLLDFSTKECPILIDQPEDSLDNRAIYIELVQYLRAKKRQRQIILVTHNPNVVVSADAENIIVANQNGKNSLNKDNVKFQYINGSLEDTKQKDKMNNIVLESQGIREHVCEILEGGKEAFENREKKYGFKK